MLCLPTVYQIVLIFTTINVDTKHLKRKDSIMTTVSTHTFSNEKKKQVFKLTKTKKTSIEKMAVGQYWR